MGSTMSMVGLAALTLVMHISIHLHFVEQEELLCESTKEDLNQSISEIASMHAEIQSSDQKNLDCKSDLAQANNQNSHSMEQIAKLEKEIDELVQQNSNCTHDLREERSMNEMHKAHSNKSISEIKSLETEMQTSQQKHSNCTDDLATANNRNVHSMKQITELETEVHELVEQNSNCTRDLAEAISSNEMQKAQLNQSTLEIESLQMELTTEEEKYSNCTDELKQAHTEISQLTQNQQSSAKAADAVPAFELDSTILTDPADIEIFHNLLKPQFNKTIGATDFKLNLLYRYTRDGSHVHNFHQKCDGVINTLTLVESNYHNVFGGFTTKSWGSKPGWYSDEKAFLYRIKSTFDHEPRIFDLKDPSNAYAVHIKPNYAPSWGLGHDLLLRDTNSKPNTAHSRLGMTYEGVGNELCGGEKYDQFNAKHWFNIVEYEVYEVNASNN